MKYKLVDMAPLWEKVLTDGISTELSYFAISFSYGDSQSFSASGSTVLGMLLSFYGYGYKGTRYSYTGAPSDHDFCMLDFDVWKMQNTGNFQRIMEAYTAEYNPIENYNGETRIVDTVEALDPYTKTKTISGSVSHDTDISTYGKSGSDIGQNDTFGSFDSKHYDTTYDDTTDPSGAKLTSRDTAPASGSYTHTQGLGTGNKTTWNLYTETETETGSKDHTETKHGNLGITTSQSMVEAEIELRKRNALLHFIRMYVYERLIQAGD